MGCGQSKPPHQRAEDSAPVALCRDRSALLAEAIRRRYALADAHRAYAASLQAAGAALHDFLRAVIQDAAPPPGPGADLLLPAHRKGEGAEPLPAEHDAKRVDDDDGGGHIHFPSAEEDDSSDEGHIQFPSDEETEPPVPQPQPPLPEPEPLQPAAPAPSSPLQMAAPYGYAPPYTYGPGPSYAYGAEMSSYRHGLVSTINYARKQPPSPSVAYEHRPQVANATVHYYQDDGAFGPPPPSSYYYGGYPYHQYPQGGSFSPAAPSSRRPAAPLPPPSPPKVSTWDFLNPFETFESYYPEQPAPMANHTPSWSSSAPTDEDEEDMPELEDEELGDVVGEAYGGVERTVVNAKLAKEEERGSSASEELHRKFMFLDAGSSSLGEEESQSSDAGSSTRSSTVHLLDKSLVEQQMKDSAVAGPPAEPVKMYNDDVQVVQEIKAQFDRASKSAGEVCKVLEVWKMPYNQNNSGLKVPSMMICGLPSMGEEFLQFEEEKAMECGNLSSTLQKLYMWEKKLLEEVKTEEKIKLLYDKKYEELKFLYNSGAEAHKLEAVQIYTRKLSTKISVAIQVVNSISDKINKLRDEELWPQTHELIQGFMQMWHTMSECHQIQCHALSQAKDIDSSIAAATFSEAHIDLVKQLELQLLDMTANVAAWFSAQKSYVSTLNEWLKKGIEYVPEVTDDGVPPFSPGRLGAHPVFTICNNWATSISRISEMEVLDTMQVFASNVLGLWERHRSEWRQGMLADKDMSRDPRLMTRDELSMRKALQAQNKKLLLVSSQGGGVSLSAQMLHDSVPPSEAGLQSCMHKSFEAMESFAAACTNALKDLHLRSQEEITRLAQENGAVS